MDKPLVSIMIPVYNDSETLGRCLMSVLEQDYDNLLVLALDNRSTDESYDILVDFERKYRDRLYIGRTHTRMSPNEHRVRCMDLMNPRSMVIEYLSPTDALVPEHVSRCIETLGADKDIGCVLSHADVIHASGDTDSAPGYQPEDCVIPGDAQMEKFMVYGFEMNTLQMYRMEVYRLSIKEGLVFNRHPGWLPLVAASSISDFGYIRSPLAFRGDARAVQGDRFIPSLEDLFEHYLFLQAFNNIAARLERQSVCGQYPKALLRLSRECARCAGVLAEANDQQTARAYLSLSLAYLPEVADTEDYRRAAGMFQERSPNWI